MAFIDKHNLLTQMSLQNSIEKMEGDRNFYTDKIKEAKSDRIDLIKNTERFARERYYMSKNNEDVFGSVEALAKDDAHLAQILWDFSRKDRDIQSQKLAKTAILLWKYGRKFHALISQLQCLVM